jgi:histidinol-phosphate aminotransferase
MSRIRKSVSGLRLRTVLDTLAVFQPSVAPSTTGPAYLLGSNESPHAPLPGVVAAITAAAAQVNRYPDFGGDELAAELGRVHGVPRDHVILGAGSAALLQVLFQAVGDPDAEVVYAWRSFELYPVFADLAGVRSVRVPLAGNVHDLKAIVRQVTERTRMIIICNPNNPTGTVVAAAELEQMMRHVPSDVLVALDEAYFEYVRDPKVVTGIVLHRRWPNLVALRTFSKAYGLAGLRVGYMIADPAVLARLSRAVLPYSVSAVAQVAAIAALRLREQLSSQVKETVAERARVRAELLASGWDVPESQANFLWLGLGSASAALGQRCAEVGVAVRVFPGQGVRVSLGSPTDNEAFLTACRTLPVSLRQPAEASCPATRFASLEAAHPQRKPGAGN